MQSFYETGGSMVNSQNLPTTQCVFWEKKQCRQFLLTIIPKVHDDVFRHIIQAYKSNFTKKTFKSRSQVLKHTARCHLSSSISIGFYTNSNYSNSEACSKTFHTFWYASNCSSSLQQALSCRLQNDWINNTKTHKSTDEFWYQWHSRVNNY